MDALSRNQVLEAFAKLRQFTNKHGRRAPHKPMLALIALGRLQNGEPRLMPFIEIEQELRTLLKDYAPGSATQHPHYPFWALRNDGVWEVDNVESLIPGKDGAPSIKSMRDHAIGGFTAPIQAALLASPALLEEVAAMLLQAHIPESRHDELMDLVQLGIYDLVIRPRRDPKFRKAVMAAYQGECVACGFRALIDSKPFGVEAAHIKWKAADGPDQTTNGLALCLLHHKALDNGSLGIRPDLTLRISSRLADTESTRLWFNPIDGHMLRLPTDRNLVPAKEWIDWHDKNVFKGPARGET